MALRERIPLAQGHARVGSAHLGGAVLHRQGGRPGVGVLGDELQEVAPANGFDRRHDGVVAPIAERLLDGVGADVHHGRLREQVPEAAQGIEGPRG
jgi:hypothetical protein